MARLFVYGSLMRGEMYHRLISRGSFLGAAATPPDYDLVDLGAYPALLPGGRTAVRGELYAVDEPLLSRIDELEGAPDYYRREEIVLADGTRAETYFLNAAETGHLPRIASGDWRLR